MFRVRAVTGLLLFVAATVLFTINNRFMLGLYPDEVLKIEAIVNGQFYYNHPLLMLETTRLVALLLRVSEPQGIVEIGRTLSALIGAIGVAALFCLLRRRVSEMTAVVVSLAAMASPLLAVHAHYLKEDVWLFGFCALALLTFHRLNDEPKPSNIALVGLCLGLAISSKTVGIFLIPVFVLTTLFQPVATRRRLLFSVALSGMVAVVVVAIINPRIAFDAAVARSDFSFEFRHALAGHWDGVSYPFGYHLTNSLWDGLGPALLVLGLLGFALALLQWRRAEVVDRPMVAYVLIYYGLIEASPLKPWPDAIRYAVPLVLPMAYFAGLATERGAAWFAASHSICPAGTTFLAVHMAIAVALVPTAATTVRLVAELANDTRLVAEGLLIEKESQVATEHYGTSFGVRVGSLAIFDPRRVNPNLRYLVASSFVYERFALGTATGGPRNAHADAIWKRYQDIFRLPYCEIRPRFMSYGFSNPTIRIIDLQASPSYSASPAPTCSSGSWEK